MIPPEALQDDDIVIAVGSIGAPTVSSEKIKRGDEGLRAVRAIEREIDKAANALLSDEIGGSKAIEPLIAAAMANLPCVTLCNFIFKGGKL